MELKIIIPNQCIVKKNTIQYSMFYKDKQGRRIPRPYPIAYYTKNYINWAKDAIIACGNAKIQHPEIKFPIDEPINLSCHFIFDNQKNVDMSNLLEGVCDVLAGNAGVCKDTIPQSYYQILEDDSVRFICSLDNCRFLYLPAEESRTIVTITSFKY